MDLHHGTALKIYYRLPGPLVIVSWTYFHTVTFCNNRNNKLFLQLLSVIVRKWGRCLVSLTSCFSCFSSAALSRVICLCVPLSSLFCSLITSVIHVNIEPLLWCWGTQTLLISVWNELFFTQWCVKYQELFQLSTRSDTLDTDSTLVK